uniref:Box C/D snoRNA protein 1-like n=1 Tax=Crassostrea virginica TaxID=6565 RepID=A0A8B8DC89_CRAVI|nr:box C/D snoRNA protein 1-like [Crassostrea virginica]XP_022325644.1 box C/D snoRNA protein 1-like [Crassostrea virginica]
MCEQHKVQTNCNGVRDKTAFVEMKAMTDMHLLSDYRMLEDVDRSIDNHSRDPLRRSGVNKVVNNMKKIAEKKGINVKFLPYPMSKRKNNSTRLSNYRTGDFLWHVELIFPQSDIKYTERRVHENTCLRDLLKLYIHPIESDPVKRQMLKSYCKASMADCHVFMQEEGLPANIKRYHQLDQEKSLSENLQGKEFIEYPTFHIVLPDSVDQYPMRTSK